MDILFTGKQRAMKAAAINANGDLLAFASWEITLEGEDYPTVNFTSWDDDAQESYDEGIMGVFGCNLRFGGDWDAGDSPLGDPPGLFPRDDLPETKFIENVDDDVFWNFPYIRLRSAVNGGELHGKVGFNCSGKSQGPFDLPEESVP